MNRELCEFYRDRGYPQFGADWYIEKSRHDEADVLISGWYFSIDNETPCKVDPARQSAIPTIPGLLRFLREKLPGYDIRLSVDDDMYEGYIEAPGSTREYDAPRWFTLDPDPTTALALAGKAALEALDEH